jgi:hypothetical protein
MELSNFEPGFNPLKKLNVSSKNMDVAKDLQEGLSALKQGMKANSLQEKELVNTIESFINKVLFSSQSNIYLSTQLTEAILTGVLETNPEFLEEMVPDFKKLKNLNKKLSVKDFLFVASQFVFSYDSQKGLSNISVKNTSFGKALNAKEKLMVVLKKPLDVDLMERTKGALHSKSGVSLLADFSNEEILSMIQSMIKNGLETIDDLSTLLQLVGELGIHASAMLMSSVSSAIQSFIEGQATIISDPMELLRIVKMIEEFSQGELVKDINFNAIGGKISELMSGLTKDTHYNDIVRNLELSPISNVGVPEISPINPEDLAGDSIDSKAAEQLAGSQFYKNSVTNSNIDKNIQSDAPLQSLTIDSAKNISQQNLGLANKNNPGELPSQEVLKSVEELLKTLNLLLEKSEPQFHDQMLDFLSDVFRDAIEKTLDNYGDL